ncbi:DUF2848 domain-containing protein [Roseovarius sp. Pro17]|uniref:DUF2848 domain-containing protein n=1 Tax=Roseovarius sp. Pro17 TaxID=3108175 RepID=UPI002D78D70A|nr:DUF2848 domain-containing protein [Roseovarius sp. Pro17]
MRLKMLVASQKDSSALDMDISHLVIAGWAGRDAEAMEHHIRELEALGVPRPKETPTFYRAAAARLTVAEEIEVLGTASSGEVEPVIFAQKGALYVGVGSDHTDRAAETHGVALSKQMCDKPIAGTVWPFAEVEQHWDDLILRSWRVDDESRSLYQEGKVSGLLTPKDLIQRYAGSEGLADGTAMFGGTLPAIGGIETAGRLECELEDPVLSRSITFGYNIGSLPIAG